MSVIARNTTLCYLEKGERYLMLHRVKKQNDLNHDKWIGVGGKFEADESPEDCLLRECREETGLTLTKYRYRGVVTFVSDEWDTEYMHLFTATGWTGEQVACEEGDLEWIRKSELLALPLWEGDRIFLRLLEEGAPFFSLKLRYEGERLAEAALNGRTLTAAERCGDALLPVGGKPALLVSACLLGCACRYDGKSKGNVDVQALAKGYRLIPVCPEQMGGLATPREPAERQGDRVVTENGRDVTEEYCRGAEEALRLAELFGCSTAILKERSPSCGCGVIHDGGFAGGLIPGDGVTAELLKARGIRVLGESRIGEL